MADLWFTADTHYNHANIITFCQRPFLTVYEMNEKLIEAWNAVVKPGDFVVHCGDVFVGLPMHAANILTRLQGRKIVTTGNHDNFKNRIHLLRSLGWHMLGCIDLGGRVRIQHKPLSEQARRELSTDYEYVIHGHTHGTREEGFTGHVDVGVDVDWEREGRPYPPPHFLTDKDIDMVCAIGRMMTPEGS